MFLHAIEMKINSILVLQDNIISKFFLLKKEVSGLENFYFVHAIYIYIILIFLFY